MSNSDLITEIEQFLAEGGEPSEPTLEEQAVAAWQKIQASWATSIAEVIQPIVQAVHDACVTIVNRLWEVYVGWRREQLRYRLRRWHVPDKIASFVAGRWPVRWLPALQLPPPCYIY